MSGGVDSAVAAARAVDAGHDVTGVHLALSQNPATLRHGARGCCTVEDAQRRPPRRRRARHPVLRLGSRRAVPRRRHRRLRRRVRRRPHARTRACAATRRSSSPRCSTARSRSASTPSSPATTPGSPTACCAARSTPAKDQSYVLAVLHPEQLAHAMFPLGDTTKDEVRAEAAARGLAVADKPDSHDICFIADGDTRGFLRARLGDERRRDRRRRDRRGRSARTTARSGSPSASGAGCTSTAPAPTASRATCCRSSPATNTVDGRPRRAARRRRGQRRPPGVDGRRAPPTPFDCAVQLRAHGMVEPAHASRVDGDGVVARLADPAARRRRRARRW